jgi:diguanylate cyclase (GGDEF)-like protein/PAS domain S-box-containing protein
MRPNAEFDATDAGKRDPVRILLLEDDATGADIVRTHLAAVGWAESQLEWVTTLDDALTRLAPGGFDLVVADLGLPDSAGLATIDALKRATDRVIVVISGNNEPGVREAALARGAYDFLHKDQLDRRSLERLVRLASMQAMAFRSLRDSEERFRSLVKLSSDFYWEQDDQYRFTFLSAELNLSGRRVEGAIGKTRWELDFVGVSEETWRQHRADLEARRPFRDLELMRYDQDGRPRWVSVAGEPVFGADRGFRGYRGVGRDITARKLAELAVRESEERFRSLTELSSDWYWEQDADFRFTYLAGRTDRMGLALNRHLGQTRWALPALNLNEEDWARHRAQLERHEPFYDFEVQRPDTDGRPHWASLSGVPVLDAQGTFKGYRGIGRDITARKLEDIKLRQFRAAMDTLADMVMLVDRETLRYVDVNQTACEMQGYTREELLRLGPMDLSGYSREELERDYDAMIASGETTRVESQQKRKDGSRFPVEILRRAVRLGERWVIVACFRDITERKRNEESLQRLGRMYAALSALNEAIPRARSREELFSRACEIAAQSGSFPLAAIRLVERGSQLAQVVASAGPDRGRFSERAVSVDGSRPEGRALVGIAFRSGEPAIADDFFSDPRTTAWHSRAATSGFKSVGVFPLRQGGECLGVLVLHGAETRAFEGEMTGLLERMAQSISFGLDRLEDEVGRRNAESALRESSERFRSLTELSADMYWEQDEQYRFTVISGRSPAAIRAGRHRMMGKHRWDQHYFSMDEAAWSAHKATLADRQPFRELELGRINEEGQQVWVSVSGEPVFDPAGAFKGYRGVSKDITARKREERLLRLEHAVTGCLSSAETVSGALKEVLRAVCEVENCEAGRYFELDEAAGVMRLREAWTDGSAGAERFTQASYGMDFKRGVGLVGNVWQSAEPVWVADVAKDDRVGRLKLARETGMNSATLLPVIFAERVIGVLAIASTRVRQPDERVLRTIRVIGLQLGQYLSRKRLEEELRRFRLAMENSADMIVLIDRATMRFVDVNETVCKLLGYTREEMLAMGPEEVLPVTRAELEKSYDEFIADPSKLSRGMKSYYRCKDGSKLPFESTRRALRSGDKWVIAAISRDIRERITAEQSLRDSEARFRSLTELSSDWYWEQDEELRFTKFEGRTRFGGRYDPASAVLGKRPWELAGISPESASWDMHRERLLRHEPYRDFEYSYYDRKGSRYYISVNGEPMSDQEGRFLGYRGTSRDVTQQRRGEDALRRFRVALDASADIMFLGSARSATFLDFNETACRVLGYTREELTGMNTGRIRVDRTPEQMVDDYGRLLGKPNLTETETGIYRRSDGTTFPVEIQRQVIETRDGPVVVARARDLTEQRRAEERQAKLLRYQEEIARFGQAALGKNDAADLMESAVQAVLEGLRADAVAYLEPEPGGDLVVRALVGTLDSGANAGSLAGAGAVRAVLENGARQVVDGATLPFAWARDLASAAVVPVRASDGVRGVICALLAAPDAFAAEELNFVDALANALSTGLQRSDSEGRLAFLAQFDPLTGLPNRALLADRFSQMIVLARRHDKPLGVLFIDLDDFKLVNDTLGHAAGDELLKETASRLQAAVRPGDTVARISGDEFAIVLNDLARPDDAGQVAQKIIGRLAEPMQLRGQEVFVTASIGIATFPADGAEAEPLLGAADAAMYRAKQAGRNAFQFFTAEINQRTRARAQLGSELRRALEREEFTLAYQPKIDLRSGLTCAGEALLRWKHPERGPVSPAEFIPVLEETGLIVAVGEWVIGRACRDIRSWQEAGLAAVPIAVNLSARQFRQQDLETRIRHLVSAAGVTPQMIELEITESQLMQDPDHAIRVTRALSEAGIRIAIDDFGTGYSSLSYLTRFPVSSLKIDRSFVAGLLSDPAHAAIARAIIDMAHTLGFIVVAEGVETDGQAAFLRGLGCEQAQGYLFARPMPAADFKALLSSGVATPASGRSSRAVRQGARRRSRSSA